ncbi:MAG: efflux RND transporter periplasmic adaptor subunit [Pirellulaceae bacterium]
MKKWWIPLGLVLLAITAWVVWNARAGTPVEMTEATTGTIRQYIDEQGKTRLPQEHAITMPFAGRLGEISLKEGDRVKQGEVVAQVVQEDVETEVAEYRAVVAGLEASIRENADTTVEQTTQKQAEHFVESMNTTVDVAKSRVEASRSRHEYAKTILGRIERLAETGARSEDDLDQARLREVEAEADYRQDALTHQAIISIDAATRLLPSMISQYIARKELTEAVLEKQKSEAEARLRLAELRLERGTMRSPIEGVVLRRHLSSEQQVAAGTPLLDIGDLNQLQVEAEILSQEVVDIRPGQLAQVYGPAVGREAGEGIEAIVGTIYPTGFTKVSSLGVEQQRVMVILHFHASDLTPLLASRSLGTEFRVQVRIFTAESQATVVVPRSAIFRDERGAWRLFAVREGVAHSQAVEVGLMNQQQAEIVSGIDAGTAIIRSPEGSLREGQRVRSLAGE